MSFLRLDRFPAARLTLLRAGCLFVFASLASGVVSGEELSATATLAPATALKGEAVELRIEVRGAANTARVALPAVDGLQITHLGTFSHDSMVLDFRRSATQSKSVVHRYAVTAQRPGEFVIPALTLDAGGRKVQTEPAALSVRDSLGEADGEARVAWAEITPLKPSAYVGEVVGVEVRLHFHPDVQGTRIEGRPRIGGDGFAKSNTMKLSEETARQDGQEHRILVLRFSITPSKAGPLFLGPVEVDFEAQVPASFGEPRSPGGPRGFPARPRSLELTAAAEMVELEVKPLPADGQPPGFAGAIGEFTLAATGKPARVKIGDPITMQVRLSGQGNFDRIDAPGLSDAADWRTYPPAVRFQAEGSSASRGTKTFEIAAIPEAKKTAMPVFEFSYFDPAKEAYATLTTAAEPLIVEGDAPPPAPVAKPAQAAAPAPPPPRGLRGILYEFETTRSWTPVGARRTFWLAQLVPLAVLIVFIARHAAERRKERANPAAVDLRAERERLIRELPHEASRARFYKKAARILQIDTASRTGRPIEEIDLATVKGAHPDGRAEEIFGAREEALYAGGVHASLSLSAPERDRVLTLLRE